MLLVRIVDGRPIAPGDRIHSRMKAVVELVMMILEHCIMILLLAVGCVAGFVPAGRSGTIDRRLHLLLSTSPLPISTATPLHRQAPNQPSQSTTDGQDIAISQPRVMDDREGCGDLDGMFAAGIRLLKWPSSNKSYI